MHFMMTWHSDASAERLAEIDEVITGCFGENEFVRPFPQTYVVNVMGNGVYEAVIMGLKAYCQAQPEKIQLLLSPLTHRGMYNGRLSEETVREIMRLSE